MNLQPDLSLSLPIKNRSGDHAITYKTVSEILTLARNQGKNAFYCLDSGYSYPGLAISLVNVTPSSVENLYMGEGLYINDQSPENMGYIGFSGVSFSGNAKVFVCSGTSFYYDYDVSPGWSAKTIDGIQYKYANGNGSGNGVNNTLYMDITYNTLYINGQLPVLYNWSSVPAITGKNNTVLLTTLKEESINDGSPVDDATASAFNNAPNSCSVGGIVSKDLPIIEGDPTSVALKYNIPPLTDATYTSVKLVAKKKKIPKSKTDGDRIIDISPSSGSAIVNNLDEQTKYYFAIFVEDNFGNKADSDPKDITTGERLGKWLETYSSTKAIEDSFTMQFTESVTYESV